MTSQYKPSPLSFSSARSPRASPFRRPESPASPSTTVRPSTPSGSPLKSHNQSPSPAKLRDGTLGTPPAWTIRGKLSPSPSPERDASASPLGSPRRTLFHRRNPSQTEDDHKGNHEPSKADVSRSPRAVSPSTAQLVPEPVVRPVLRSSNGSTTVTNDSISKLTPTQLREMREAFQILDRDSDGQVTRDDVQDMLVNLGADAHIPISTFFPPGPTSSQKISLPTFLATLSVLLTPLSPPSELLAAFSAFDPDDSGQIDVTELREALLHTTPEPGEVGRTLSRREIDEAMKGMMGRRVFGKSSVGGSNALIGKRGEVFKYRDFVAAIEGGASGEESGAEKK